MSVTRARVPQQAFDRLGQEGVQYVLRNLYAVDCMSCDLPLGRGKLSIQFLDFGAWLEASLHHRHCAPAIWATPDGRPPRQTSYSTHDLVALWDDDEGSLRELPIVIVNPSLELITLSIQDGRPQVCTTAPLGFEQYANSQPYRPTPGVHLAVAPEPIRDGHSEVVVYAKNHRIWPLVLASTFVDVARQEGGLMIYATHDIDPTDVDFTSMTTFGALDQLLREGHTTAAWATFLDTAP